MAAVEKVTNEGWTVARAAREHGVPRVTLLDNVKGTHKTGAPGRPTVLSKCEEEVLVSRIVLFGQYNYPVSKRHLRDMVKAYLDKRRDTIFKENRPGKNWVKAFLKRHADQVVVRTPTNIRRSRAAVSPAEIRQYFANLAREVEGVPPMNVFNYDETNFRDDPVRASVSSKRVSGTRNRHGSLHLLEREFKIFWAPNFDIIPKIWLEWLYLLGTHISTFFRIFKVFMVPCQSVQYGT